MTSILDNTSLQPVLLAGEIEDLSRELEALLFVACEPLSIKRLCEITGAEASQVLEALLVLAEHYHGRGFILRQLAGGWQFVTAPAYNGAIEKLYRPKVQQLSRAALETLAIVAYKQPVTRQDIENIRQVNIDRMLSNLLDKRLVKEVGRRESLGRPVLYGTTDQFLIFFGLKSLDELPPPESFPINEADLDDR
ncbi:MAG: SMC-Scp complex subunit ScpB [Clostridiales bacterium]|nr:SMC-Scp complex subunit ScpB [Clostridiales bacterium]MDR2713473.1 SMC-Scp complex subunit ScpB [Clostridiales bacterium]